jgi:hypothetical protein
VKKKINSFLKNIKKKIEVITITKSGMNGPVIKNIDTKGNTITKKL